MSAADKLRQLDRLATPGPWRVGSPDRRCLEHEVPHPGPPHCKYTRVGWAGHDHEIHVDGPGEELVAGTWNYEEGGVLWRVDANLIAALRNALTLLADLVEAATEAVGYADEGDYEAVLDVTDSELRTALDALREHLGVTE